MRVKKMRKSFITFLKEDSRYTRQWLVHRCQIMGCQRDFLKTPYRFIKKPRFEQKIPGRRKIR